MLVLTEVQKITLRDILTTAGLTNRQVEDIFLLLRFKPERVQLVFYYRACEFSQNKISEKTGIPQQTISDIINNNLNDIKLYLYGTD